MITNSEGGQTSMNYKNNLVYALAYTNNLDTDIGITLYREKAEAVAAMEKACLATAGGSEKAAEEAGLEVSISDIGAYCGNPSNGDIYYWRIVELNPDDIKG